MLRPALKGETYKWHTEYKYMDKQAIAERQRQRKHNPHDTKPLLTYIAKYMTKQDPATGNRVFKTGKLTASQGYGKQAENAQYSQYRSDKRRCENGYYHSKHKVETFTLGLTVNPKAIHAFPGTMTREQRLKRLHKVYEKLRYEVFCKPGGEQPFQLCYPRIWDEYQTLLSNYWGHCTLRHNQDEPPTYALDERRIKDKYLNGYYTKTLIHFCWSHYGYDSTQPMPIKTKVNPNAKELLPVDKIDTPTPKPLHAVRITQPMDQAPF